jgi:hydroxymethylbilane synthase
MVAVTTTGDVDRTSPVATLTEVGAFVRAVQHAVIEGSADLAVHSCKDLPIAGPGDLSVFYPERGSPWDAICGSSLAGLRPNARVGTGSPRRAAQLALLRPDLEIIDIRGNVDTRLGKVDRGELQAVVLAEAGLTRAGLGHRIAHQFGVMEMVPAPGQGALAMEAPVDSEVSQLLGRLDHAATRSAVEAERLLLANTGAGCRSALGALARAEGGQTVMWGFVEDGAGPRRGRAAGSDPQETARSLQEELGL